MELKSRAALLVNKLLANQFVNFDNIQSELSITQRTLYYDISNIKEWLDYHHVGEILIEDKQISLDVSNVRKFKKLLGDLPVYYYSKEERLSLEFLFIVLSAQKIKIETFVDMFEVSKNTILNDFKVLKEELSEIELELRNTIQEGYFIVGEEMTIRKRVGQIIIQLTNAKTIATLKNELHSALQTLVTNDIDYIEISRCIIKQYEIDNDTQLLLNDNDYELIMILVAMIRHYKGYSI